MKNFRKFMSGKGYYIALVLCAVAIGISGYLYYRNADETKKTDKAVSVAATNGDSGNMAVAGTQPITGQTTVKDPVTVTKPLQTASPVEGETVMVYAIDQLSYNPTTRDWRTHNGVDIAAKEDTPVCAAAAGTVHSVYEDDTMGTTVVISHEGGYKTYYASLAKEVSVAEGDTVAMGQKIGTVGETALLESAIGEHVHFSVTCNDSPMDPAEFLKQE